MKSELKNGNFIQKLQCILKNQEYKQIIDWTVKNTTIEILDPKKMEEEILPMYFRHSKFESFVRQLNIYGFKKIKSVSRNRFTHPLLQSGYELSSITSVKNCKEKEVPKIVTNQIAPNTNLSPQNAFAQQNSNKQVSSGAYNLMGQNRNTTLFEKDLNQNQFNSWQGSNFSQIMIVPAHQYFMWNYMNGFNGFQASPNVLNTETMTP